MRVVLVGVALLAVSLPGATTAAEPRFTAERLKLRDAIELEQKAWGLLAKQPPRIETAKLQLERSARILREIAAAVGAPLADELHDLAQRDAMTARGLERGERLDWAFFSLESLLKAKSLLLGKLQTPKAGPQCADGRDSDGDRLVDAAFDSGCTSAKDRTERSPLTCSLQTKPGAGAATVEGTCSGPYFKLELIAPDGTRIDATPVPQVRGSEGCRYATPRRLECLMQDGLENRGHGFGARLRFREGFASSFRARITDFGGRARTWTAAAGTADVRVAARIDTAFMDRDGNGRVSGVLTLANRGAGEARGLRLVVTSNRLDSARAAELDGLSCTRTDAGTSCALPPLTPNVELAFPWAMPASGAGRFTATFAAAGRTATVETDLRPQP